MIDKSTPLMILLTIPMILLLRVMYNMVDNRTNEIKKAKSVVELTFSDYERGFKTSSLLYRYINILIVYVSFLSIFDFKNLLPHLIITIIGLIIGFMINKDSKVFIFNRDSFIIRPYINISYNQIVFRYNEIEKIEYYIGGRGSAQIRIYNINGHRKKITFVPNFIRRDAKLIQMILSENSEFEIKMFRLKNIFD
jgi:hypothetical protein